ncbi:PEP-CTERM sorting domain-containing protein [Pelomonas margarita]|uniref:PEP-CTERM sorting domain-containing protein n=1 Tax=Pelomonas margarita TaxID=3299031 RepID=A0ABW7FFY9_9BURK
MKLPLSTSTALALLSAGAAHAADASFSTEQAFVAAAGATVIESFETLAGRDRTLAPIVTSTFTLSTAAAPMGIQTSANAPSDGFGAAAVDGSQYVSIYLQNLAPGSISFTLAAPSTSFGLYLSDLGETSGQIRVQTNNGVFASGLVVATFPPTVSNGQQRFVGVTQNQAFTQVTLTVTGVDEAYGLDKVYVSAVPEPAAAWLMLAGLGVAGIAARSRRAR